MTDATVQMLVSQLGNPSVKNSSKKELIEAAAGLPDFGNILSNAGQKNDKLYTLEERGASQSWSNKDVADSDASVSKKTKSIEKMLMASNEPSNQNRVTGKKEMSLSEKLGFGSGETDVEEMADALVYLASRMMDVLTEKFNVTEEQVTNCLEQNNLIMTDLLDSTKLADVFVQLSGKNIEAIDVVNDEEFTSLLKAFDEEVSAIFEEMPVEKSDLMSKAHILVDYDVIDVKMTEIHTGEQVTSDDDSVIELLQDAPKSEVNDKSSQLSDNMEILYTGNEAVKGTDETTDNNNADMNNGENNSNGGKWDQTVSPDGDPNKKLVYTTGGDPTPAEMRDLEPKEYDESLDLINVIRNRRKHGMGYMPAEPINIKPQVNPTVNTEIPIVEFSDMTAKVQEFIETLTKDTKITSLSMQLNPENLGKVTVELATKEGVVSAKVIAETQAAKEALEANLANLKSNLEQQGIKIADVEVTVESHAFEQNLQQDGSREQEQLAKEMQQETVRNLRTINLREVGLAELKGLMSEEDIVVAKMMADNGNTLNIKA
ncbi:MAG: flagellar hook-length control protein FliK [Lachnospiraceae bacterium]|nr:flagellar hook-length control protein FliK [Lachnospiraceae bacterium]